MTLVAYGSSAPNDNPARKYVDWKMDTGALEVVGPVASSHIVAPGTTMSLVQGAYSYSTSGTTAVDIELVDADTYRMRHTAGTDPVFRVRRSVDLSAETVDVVVNANSTVTMTTTGSWNPGGIQVGDIVWIPDTDEVGSQPFHVTNRGFWVVLAAGNTTMTLKREGDFEGIAQSGVAITLMNQLIAFSTTGAQAGDTLHLLEGFASPSLNVYSIQAVTPFYIEFQSTVPIAEEQGVLPTSDGFAVYYESKRFVYLESDQEVTVLVNGDTGSYQLVSPPNYGGNPDSPGVYMRIGPTWSLSVVSRSPEPANVTFIAAG